MSSASFISWTNIIYSIASSVLLLVEIISICHTSEKISDLWELRFFTLVSSKIALYIRS